MFVGSHVSGDPTYVVVSDGPAISRPFPGTATMVGFINPARTAVRQMGELLMSPRFAYVLGCLFACLLVCLLAPLLYCYPRPQCANQVPFPKELWDRVSEDAKDFIKVRPFSQRVVVIPVAPRTRAT